eukprot:Skav207014  [mRNA]  locus=scaffold2740:75336:76567:- [translate_table: standard]
MPPPTPVTNGRDPATNGAGVHEFSGAGDQRLMDKIVAKHKKDLQIARQQVACFLYKNGFPDCGKVNKPKGKWCVTYPLHEAVKQNNAYITSKLLLFGARPMVKDFMGRTPYGYAAKRHSTHQDILKVFHQAGTLNLPLEASTCSTNV